MRTLRSTYSRLKNLFARRRQEREMALEMEAHLAALAERRMADGLSAEEARYAALREFGGVEQAKEKCRDARTFRPLEEVLRDLRFAVRHFARTPGFALVAILSLGIAIGANTSIFSLLNSTLFRPVDTERPAELMLLSWTARKWPAPFSQTGGDSRFSFSYPAFDRLLRADTGMRDLFAVVPAGFGHQNLTVIIDGKPALANGLMVTGNYFGGLRLKLPLGRGITEADQQPGRERVAVISDSFWARCFNRDPGVIGRTVMVNNVPCTIAGVAHSGVRGFVAGALVASPDLWLPFSDGPTLRPWGMPANGSRSIFTANNWICLNVVGRLPAGVSRAAAEARLDAVFQTFVHENWPSAKPSDLPRVKLVPCGYGAAGIRDQVSMPLTVLMAGVALLLVVACANLATLLLARANARQKELSVRAAVGASRGRLVRQLLTESMLLAMAGGLFGLLVAVWGDAMLVRMVAPSPEELPFRLEIDGRAFAFALLVSLATGVLFGLLPGWRATDGLAAGGMNARSVGAVDRRAARLGRLLIAGQLAFSLLLLVCGALFGRTLRNMENRDLGFDGRRLLVFGLDPTRAGYEGARLRDLYDDLRLQLLRLPGVSAVTLLENYPFTGANNGPFRIEGSKRTVTNPVTRWQSVGPDFCATLGARLVAGRDILPRDSATAPRVAIVNQAFVREFLGDTPPLGQRLVGPLGKEPFEIVGVFHEIELTDLHAPPKPKAFVPYVQLSPGGLNTMYFEVRAAGDPLSLAPPIRAVARKFIPEVPLIDLAPQASITRQAMFGERLFARLVTFFGLASVLVSSIGLYGTVAYQVTRRTTEIGIRMSLGSTPRAVVMLFLRQSLPTVAVGVVVGLGLSLAASAGLRGLLYGVGTADPVSFAVAGTALIGIALAACWLPARRAAKVDPTVALRAE